jgi:hypothetical protein
MKLLTLISCLFRLVAQLSGIVGAVEWLTGASDPRNETSVSSSSSDQSIVLDTDLDDDGGDQNDLQLGCFGLD